jgi:hypothetical protein
LFSRSSGGFSAVARLARLVQPLQLAVGLAEQPLDRRAALEAAVAQRLDDAADDPPQLEHRLVRGDLLERSATAATDLEVLRRRSPLIQPSSASW